VRDGDARGKAFAAAALGNLADGDDAIKAAIAAAGAIEPLVALLCDGDAQGKANAADALRTFADGDDAIKAAIAEAVSVEALVMKFTAQPRTCSSMALTNGAMLKMFQNDATHQPVVQLLEVKLISHHHAEVRHRMIVSDGVNYMQGMMATQLNHYIESGQVQSLSVIKLTEFVCHVVQNRKIIIVLNCDVVRSSMPMIIGQPLRLDDDGQPVPGSLPPGLMLPPPQQQPPPPPQQQPPPPQQQWQLEESRRKATARAVAE
jgi:hypothetical protein